MTVPLRRAITGLLSFAAAEEQALLAETAFGPDPDRGGPDRWAALPVVAHQAARTLAEAIEANPALRANVGRDPDLRVLREASP